MKYYKLTHKDGLTRWWAFNKSKCSLMLQNENGYFLSHNGHDEAEIRDIKGVDKITEEEFDQAVKAMFKWWKHET